MSSPLATLKKGSARSMPFRAQQEFQVPPLLSNKVSTLDVDKALLEDVVNAEVKKKDQGMSDFALTQSMLSRIQQLEKQVQSQAKEIIEKDRIINKYQEQVDILQKATDISESKSKTTELQAQCFIMRKQVEQMEEFLADYGLIWVGDSDDDEETEDTMENNAKQSNKLAMPLTSRVSGYWSQQASLAGDGSTFVPNFDVLLKNIKELNVLAGEGQSQVHCDLEKNEARLRPTETIPLAIYNNGLLLFDGPFRPYADRETRQLVVDILDGYFPSELQPKYPEGVPFKVVDRREVVYKDKVTEIFAGKGRRLKSADNTTDSSESQVPALPLMTSDEHKTLSGKTMTEDQFLGKLPKNVVKSGKIVDIRESVATTMHSSGNNASNNSKESGGIQVIETKLVQELRERMASGDGRMASAYYGGGQKGRPGTPRGGGLLVTLRIRSEDGSQTYVLKVRPSETIGDIRNYINTHRKSAKSGKQSTFTENYAIVQSFPKQVVFEDPKATLEKCGLMSNAALFLRRNANPDAQTSARLLSSSSKESQTT